MQDSSAQVGWQVSPSQAKIDTVQRYAVGQRALDLGCGRGWYATVLADMGLTITGLDQKNRVEDERITVVEQLIAPPLPFADDAFDTVLMFDILEHLPHEAEILAEIARICQGRVIVSVPHADDGPLPRYGLTYLHHTDNTHLREYLPAELSDKFGQVGFEPLLIELKGQPTIPLVFSEFVRGGPAVQQVVRYGITALYKLGLITNSDVAGDIFYVGEQRSK